MLGFHYGWVRPVSPELGQKLITQTFVRSACARSCLCEVGRIGKKVDSDQRQTPQFHLLSLLFIHPPHLFHLLFRVFTLWIVLPSNLTPPKSVPLLLFSFLKQLTSKRLLCNFELHVCFRLNQRANRFSTDRISISICAMSSMKNLGLVLKGNTEHLPLLLWIHFLLVKFLALPIHRKDWD